MTFDFRALRNDLTAISRNINELRRRVATVPAFKNGRVVEQDIPNNKVLVEVPSIDSNGAATTEQIPMAVVGGLPAVDSGIYYIDMGHGQLVVLGSGGGGGGSGGGLVLLGETGAPSGGISWTDAVGHDHPDMLTVDGLEGIPIIFQFNVAMEWGATTSGTLFLVNDAGPPFSNFAPYHLFHDTRGVGSYVEHTLWASITPTGDGPVTAKLNLQFAATATSGSHSLDSADDIFMRAFGPGSVPSGGGGEGGGVDEVWVGPDEPTDPETELWYDPDAPMPTWFGAPLAGTATEAVGYTSIGIAEAVDIPITLVPGGLGPVEPVATFAISLTEDVTVELT